MKQGDHLSPLLFNMVLDPLLKLLDASGFGMHVDGMSVAALAFADDLVLLANDKDDLQRLLTLTSDFFDQ